MTIFAASSEIAHSGSLQEGENTKKTPNKTPHHPKTLRTKPPYTKKIHVHPRLPPPPAPTPPPPPPPPPPPRPWLTLIRVQVRATKITGALSISTIMTIPSLTKYGCWRRPTEITTRSD